MALRAVVAVAVARGHVTVLTIPHLMVLAVVAGPRVYALVAGRDLKYRQLAPGALRIGGY